MKAVQNEARRDDTITNWTNILFFGITHSLAIVAWPVYLLLGGGFQWQEAAVFLFMFALGIIGINVGYHRALSHLSFKMSPALKFLALFGGASSVEGSALMWCADHRRHHKFQDTDKDPYNINKGFWWAHMGWLFGSYTTNDFSNCPDLNRDPLIRHQHKYYLGWLIVSSFLLPLGLGFLLGRPVACFLLGGLVRLFVFNQVTFLVNSYAHYFGRKPFSTEITARDSWVCAFLANGEGWHNFHHKFPFDYRCGPQAHQYDPAKWFISLGSVLGFCKDLKRTPAQEIYRARIQTQREKYAAHPAAQKSLSESLDEALDKWTALGLEWQRIRTDFEKRGSEQMRVLKVKLAAARHEFKHEYAAWKSSLKRNPYAAN